MAPRRATPARRYHLTLDRSLADRLGAYAEATRRPVSTVAGALIASALTRVRTEELTALGVPGQPGEAAGRHQVVQRPPRWEWPVSELLADTEWWDRWLPRLNELSGRRLTPLVPLGSAVDGRGYVDLMAFLFPAVVRSGRTLTWRSTEYPEAAAHEMPAGNASQGMPERAQVWEPVIRHVTEALCALESTGQPGADPYLRLRAEAEIAGPWARILRYLVGDDEPVLPRRGPG